MNKMLHAIIGAGIGAGAMYWFDPKQGAARRTLLRQRALHYRHELQSVAGKTAHDVQHRLRGVAAETVANLPLGSVSDPQVAERVRSAIGRMVAHPGAIDLQVLDGRVFLRGPILANEVDWLIARVWALHGVKAVDNQLEVHSDPTHIPALQGVPKKNARTGERAHEWNPSARLGGGLLGATLAAYGAAKSGWWSKLLALSGAALFLRAASNMEIKNLTGIGTRRGVNVQKNIAIDAPVEHVYGLWADCENLPRFMSHVREVKKQGERRWHWVVDGPAGTPVEFESVVTAAKPYRRLSWKTVPGSLIQHYGTVRFEPRPDRSTAVYVSMNYRPVAGGVGHMIAKMLGVDPKKQIDDDLMRMKTFIETGNRSQDAAANQRRGATTPAL